MSDAMVGKALDQMEAWLSEPDRVFEAGELSTWNQTYFAAVASAERGPAWVEIVMRAHRIGKALNERMSTLIAERDELKEELESFARGNRALKGYGANTR